MARNVYVTTALTGGGQGLDGLDGAGLVKGDLAIFAQKDSTTLAGTHGTYFAIYYASTHAASENAPGIIVPDVNPGSFNWKAAGRLWSIDHTTGKAATLANNGISIIRTTGASVHILRRPRAGAYKKLIFATTSPVKVRMTTAVAGSLAAPTVRIGRAGLVAGSSVCVVIAPTSRALTRLPASIEFIGRTTARWEITGYENMSTGTVKRNITFSSST
jgi:hypothetical protein